MSASPVKRSVRAPHIGNEIPPGPNAGRVWHDPPATYRDPLTDRLVTRLTSYRGHSHHLAGPASCWFDHSRQLVIVSDREGCANLFAHNFATAALTQLTDLRGTDQPGNVHLTAPMKLAFTYGAFVYEIELDSLRMREVRTGGATRRPRELAGEAATASHGRVVWFATPATPRARRIVAVATGSGLAPQARTAPCVRPGAAQVIFVSDASGYAQIHAVEAHDPASLPLLATFTGDRPAAGTMSVPRPTSPQA